MERLIKNADELYLNFYNTKSEGTVYVSTSIRKNTLCGERQGKITIDGTVRKFNFVGIGGVYEASIINLSQIGNN